MFRASVAFYLFLSVLLLLSSRELQANSEATGEESGQQAGGDSGDVTGKSGSHTAPNRYKLACLHVRTSLEEIIYHYEDVQDVFADFRQRYEASDSTAYIHAKARPATTGSICPLNISCCTTKMEKELLTLSHDEFKKYYHSIINTHVESCPASGKRLFKSSRIIMDIIMKNLENQLNQTLEGTLPDDTLANLTQYLSYFSAIADSCPIQQLLKDQLDTLTEVTLAHIFADNAEFTNMLEDPISLNCMKNTTLELVQEFYLDIFQPMQRQLHDLGQFVRALKVAGHALDTMRGHTLSESCVAATIRMQYCPLCSGYGRFKPCRNLCVNTLRGCFADIAEIHGPFRDFVKQLRTLSVSLIEDFRPDNFVDKYLKQFVGMVNYLKQNEDTLEKKLTQECSTNDYDTPDSDSEVTLSRKRRSIFQPVQESTRAKQIDPLVEQIDFKDMTTVMEAELVCLERLAVKMVGVPEDICILENKLSQGGNTLCWTGTNLGEYYLPQAELLKQDQLNNPVYATLPLETDVILYSSLIQDVHTSTANLERTIAFRERCQESDDEDCGQVLYNQCFQKPVDMESGSGSGSGSASGSGSGFEDYLAGTEDYERPTVYTEIGTPTESVSTSERVHTQEPTTEISTSGPSTDPFTVSTMIIDSERGSTETPPTTNKPTVQTTEEVTEVSTTEGTTVKPFLVNNQLGGFFPFPLRERSLSRVEAEGSSSTKQTRQTKTQEVTLTTTKMTIEQQHIQDEPVTLTKLDKPTTQIFNNPSQGDNPIVDNPSEDRNPITHVSNSPREDRNPTTQISHNLNEDHSPNGEISDVKEPDSREAPATESDEGQVFALHHRTHIDKNTPHVISSSASMYSSHLVFMLIGSLSIFFLQVQITGI